jgi:MFS family permease
VGHYGIMASKETTSQYTIGKILVRDYVLSFLAFFLFLGAFHSLTPTLPLYLAKLGSNKGEIGILVGAIGVASLVSRLLVGRILFRHSEKSVMMGGAMLFALTFLALVVFRPFWPFLVVRIVQGVAFASLDTAAIAYAIRIVPEEYRARGIGYFLLATSLASALAATSSVFIVNAYGFTILLLSCTVLSLCAFVLSWSLKSKVATSAAGPSAKNTHYFEPRILAPALVSFLFFLSWAGIAAFFPLYSVECGVKNPGIFFSATASMIIIVRAFGGRIFELYSREKIIPTFIVVSMIAYVILAFSHSLPMFIFVGLLSGAALAFLIPVAMAYALQYARSSDGSAIATYQISMDLALAVGPVIAGFVIPFAGYRATFLCLAFTCLINFAYFQFYLRKKNRAIQATPQNELGIYASPS